MPIRTSTVTIPTRNFPPISAPVESPSQVFKRAAPFCALLHAPGPPQPHPALARLPRVARGPRRPRAPTGPRRDRDHGPEGGRASPGGGGRRGRSDCHPGHRDLHAVGTRDRVRREGTHPPGPFRAGNGRTNHRAGRGRRRGASVPLLVRARRARLVGSALLRLRDLQREDAPPRDAEDLAYRCSSIRGTYFSTANLIFCGSDVGGIRRTSSALRPPWTIRYRLVLERMITLSKTSLVSAVTVSAEPTRTANIDP